MNTNSSSSSHSNNRQLLTVIGEINLNATNMNHLTSLSMMPLGDTVISSFISPLTSGKVEEQTDEVTKLNTILE